MHQPDSVLLVQGGKRKTRVALIPVQEWEGLQIGKILQDKGNQPLFLAGLLMPRDMPCPNLSYWTSHDNRPGFLWGIFHPYANEHKTAHYTNGNICQVYVLQYAHLRSKVCEDCGLNVTDRGDYQCGKCNEAVCTIL